MPASSTLKNEAPFSLRHSRHSTSPNELSRAGRPTPLARAIALALASVAGSASGMAHAQQAFSPAWFSAKGAAQSTAATTGRAPNGQAASSLTGARQQQRASEQAQRSINNLNFAARVIAAQQAAQAAARQAALNAPSDIPDGLTDGGLKVDTNALTAGWLNAEAPVQTIVDGRTHVTIEQTGDKAILNWETFNVGRNTTVDFEQQASWTALNRVNDPQARPSQVAGQIKADGSVYIINRNGVIFTGSSQIDTASLTASALNISDDQFETNFITTAWNQNEPTFQVDNGFVAGAIEVQAGAQLEAAKNGRILLLGGDVSNEGTLRAKDGQVLLGASQSAVYLAASNDPAMRGLRIQIGGNGGHARNGGVIDTPRGNVTLAGRDVTLGALDANGQRLAGVLTATTTVTANGSVILQAGDLASKKLSEASVFIGWAPSRTGTVAIEPGAIVQVLPELANTQTVASEALLAPSRIELQGMTLHVGAGAMLQAPAGDLVLSAFDASSTAPFFDASQVYVDQGAILDVSGTRDVALSVLRNFVQVELRGAELADNPLIYDELYGKKVWIDIRDHGAFEDPLMRSIEWLEDRPGAWQGSPLFNAAGYVGLIQRGIGELTSRGGDITIESRGDVIVREGSQLNVSGGALEYAGGMTPVSYVIDSGGRFVPVGQAEYGQLYQGIAGVFAANHVRWGAQEQYANRFIPKTYRYEEGYTEGQAAGAVRLVGNRVAVHGDIFAIAEAGERQQREGEIPTGGTLIVGANPADPIPLSARTFDHMLDGDVLIQQHRASVLAPAFGDRLGEEHVTVLSAQAIEDGGVGQLEIYSNSQIVLDESVDLDLGAGGALQLGASDITVGGTVRAAGGTITLHADKTRDHLEATPSIAIGSGAVLDTSGEWRNAFVDGALPGVLDGGTVSLLTQGVTPAGIATTQVASGDEYPAGSITLADGAVIDVSAGGRVDRSGTEVQFGDAGAITIGAHEVDLSEGVELRGYALATQFEAGRGGSLVLIGAGDVIGGEGVDGTGQGRHFDTNFFNAGGFNHYSIDGIDSLTVEANTQLRLAQRNRLILDPRRPGSGVALSELGEETILADGIRPFSNLTLRAGRTTWTPSGSSFTVESISGSVLLGQNSLIDVGIGGSFSTAAPDQVVIAGTVIAPGGSITAGINVPPLLDTPAEPRAIWLTEEAELLARGAFLPTPNIHGQRTGQVLAGGTVKLDASAMGHVVTEAGSVIDVSGAVAQVDVPDYVIQDRSDIPLERSIAPQVRNETVWSDGGRVVLTMRDGGYLDGNIAAHAAHEAASGGAIAVLIGADPSNQNFRENNDSVNQRTLVLGQDHQARRPQMVTLDAEGRITQLEADPGQPQRSVYVSADGVTQSGAQSLQLAAHDVIAFDGDVELALSGSLNLQAGTLRVDAAEGAGSARVELSAAHVAIGVSDSSLLRYVPATTASAGVGDLVIHADELLSFGGRAVLANIDSASFLSDGDLRFDGGLLYQQLFDSFGNPIRNAAGIDQWNYLPTGTLSAAGDLTFGARQLYPGIGSNFTVETSGDDATLSILPGDVTAPLPWSAGGNLTLRAANIVHAGVLRAPAGQIRLDAGDTGTVTLAAGSLIDVSAHDRNLPYGTVINGDWYVDFGSVPDPLNSTRNTLARSLIQIPPDKRVSVAGESIDIQSGAVVDLSGGGDITAYEFTPGTGGSRNILQGAGVYAVLPGAQPGTAPMVGGKEIPPGESVYLSGVPGLSDGLYTLLPAQYALLPGAFRVSLAGASDQGLGLLGTRNDGSYVVSGWRGSSLHGSRDARNSTWLVMPGDVVREYSEFTEVVGNEFFAEHASDANRVVPPLMADAGQLVLNAASALNLEGRFNLAAGKGGRGGLADIASNSIAVVADGAGPVDGYSLTIEASALTDIGAQSLLLGGTRVTGVDGQTLMPVSNRVLIANDEAAALVGPEILLATASDIDSNGGVSGTGAITVASGAVIRAEGNYVGASTALSIGNAQARSPAGTGMGSLLVVSNAKELLVQRHDIAGPGSQITGEIDVQGGATLTATESILFDATTTSTIDEAARVRARSLEIASSVVSFGAAPTGTPGFIATPNTLAALSSAERLVLRSYGTIDFYGNGSFDLRDPATGLSQVKELVLDGGALVQRQEGDIAVGAGTLTLRNTSGSLGEGSEPGTTQGALVLDAKRIRIAQGDSRLLGFDSATLAAGSIEFGGAGSLVAGAEAVTDLVVASPLITTTDAANQSIAATGTLRLARGDHAPPAESDIEVGTGGVLEIDGATIDVDTRILMPSGVLTVDAKQALNVGPNATLDVSGRDEQFFDQKRTLPAGNITLISQTGDVHVHSGALLNLSDPKGGGKLTVTVPEGSFTIEGEARGGSLLLDAGALPGFGAMQAVLNDGGFAVSRSVRLRSGDALIDGVTRTRNFSLSTDEGSITVTGTIDASGPTGGSIKLTAADDITLVAGSKLSVVGQNFDGSGKGGSVFLSAGAHRIVDGQDVTNYGAIVDIQAGSLIDLGVANAAAAAKIVSLDAIGSSVALPAANALGFPDGTPADTTIVSSVAATIVYADGTTAELAPNTPVSLPKGAILKLSAAGTVSVASGGGKVAVVLPTTGAFTTNGATTVTSVPVTLNAPGSTITLAGGTPVILPNGTPGDDIITTTAESVSITTVSEGSQVTLTAGTSTLELTSGSSVTVASGAPDASFTVGDDAVTVDSGTSSSVVTLTRGAGSSVKSASTSWWENGITFSQGVAAGSRVTIEDTGTGAAPTRYEIYQPVGAADTTITLEGNGTIRLPAGNAVVGAPRVAFPSGSPAGATLVANQAVTVYAPDGSATAVAQNQPFVVPAGGSVQVTNLSRANLVMSENSTPFQVMLDNRNYSRSGSGTNYEVMDFASTQFETIAAQTRMFMRSATSIQSPIVVRSTDTALSLGLSGAWEVTDATVAGLGAGTRLEFSRDGVFAPSGNGEFALSLSSGRQYVANRTELGRLAAGTVLTLGQDGRLDFASGTSGAIPVLLPAAARFASSGASVFDLGGGQAGTLHLRAPQTNGGTGLGIAPINGTILGAASIIAEGYKVYDLTDSNGLITSTVQTQVRTDAEAFASHTAAIKAGLLANNPGLSSVLLVAPGAEIINANTDAAGNLTAQLGANGTIGLPANTTITLPAGLSDGRLVGSENITLELVIPADGARVSLVTESYLTVPAGVPISFPEGTTGGTTLSSLQWGGTIIEPDGTTRPLYSDNPTALQPGSLIILEQAAAITASGGVPLIAQLPAGSFAMRNASLLALPAGTTVKSHYASDLTLRAVSDVDPAALPIVLPNSGNFIVNGVAFGAAAGGAAQLTLVTPDSDGVSVTPDASVSLPNGGSVRVSAPGAVYAADGSVVASFNAGDIVTVAAGNTIRLASAGTVTTQQPNLAIRVAGAGFAPVSPANFTEMTLFNEQSSISGTAGARVTLIDEVTAEFVFHSSADATIYDWDGNVFDVIPAGGSAWLVSGFTVELSTAGTLTLEPQSWQTPNISAVVQSGSFQALGSTHFVQIPMPTATLAAPSGDVRLPADWNLADDRFGADRVPGILTLRAAGDIVLDGSLSDGFAGGVTGSTLLSDRSWSYRLVGGADFAGADVLAVRPEFQLAEGKGNVILAPGTSNRVVRTGTGEIDVAAGRDIELRSSMTAAGLRYSSLYTAGRPGNVQPGGGAFSTLPDGRVAYGGGSFTLALGGGDISLTAQRDIVGAARDTGDSVSTGKPQEFSDWVLTRGETDRQTGLFSEQPAWGIAYANHREGASTLGGGNITVNAGRDLLQMNVAAANSGVYVGAGPRSAALQTLGGGDVSVTTGRDVLGSQVYVAQGAGLLDVGRNIGAVQSRLWSWAGVPVPFNQYDSRLALGDASFDVVTRGDAAIAGVFNPTLTYALTGSNGIGSYTYLSTYTDRSAISIASIAGDVWLSSNPGLAASGRTATIPNGPSFQEGFKYTLYPGTVEAVSFTGDLKVGSDAGAGIASGMLMAPARDGDLTLLAAGDIRFELIRHYDNALRNVVMSDADPSVLLTPTRDLTVLATAIAQPQPDFYPAYDRSSGHAESLYRREDANPVRIYAREGDIIGVPFTSERANGPTIVMPKRAEIRAGRDIIDLSFIGQHFEEGQTTNIVAGRDFREQGIVEIDGWGDGNGVWIGGPGRLEMSAGRNFDLAKSAGIQSVGDQLNPFLPEDVSADISLTVGTGAGAPDYAGFAAAYIDPAARSGRHNYAAELLEFMRERSGNDALDANGAWALFNELPEGERNAFVREIHFKELARVGTEAVRSGTGNYNAGYDAVETLFPTLDEDDPTPGYAGELSLRYSQIKSWYDGDINILAPGGGIDGGVAVVGPEISQSRTSTSGGVTTTALKNANLLGIVSLRGGDINIMAHDHVIVNQSRVFAIGGGDLIVWSSEGDINAGKGAKTALLAPPPRLVFDPATGGFSLELTGAASGSGLATLITEPDQEPGDVWLMAPHGVVDAGDAGIRVAGNLIIAAQEVRGVDNIEVEGLSFGVPANTVNVAALSNASVTAAQAATAAQEVVQRERAAARQALPSVFSVRVLGFGEERALLKQQPGRSGAQPSYDPGSAIQVLGDGELTESQKSKLTTTELRNWRRQ
ncbi:filamentous hemagglutinin family protein [Steroidobacter sp. S1-65]|uniref:Filamentous hemagglutinin family protein n=1 Tax=Steroidobacter gossypii TaxID=2805490 RepID=A0ABS1WZG0_9GAMM|nr:filamentous haemagglutinin family protein [Steroidobacter gossypii]MBM0106356.1 filamentous hemagglutinin family protein [Steroidobacter gossypii]